MILKQVSGLVNDLLYDIEAEFIAACLLSDGLSDKDIVVILEGPLRRKWSQDINGAGVEQFENGEEAVCLRLNRSGLYDELPEALFHRFYSLKNATAGEMRHESAILNSEERSARLLFRPFENEIFRHRAILALKENLIFDSICSGTLNALIPGLLKINERIPCEYRMKLMRILPFAPQFTGGDYQVTAECLQYILEEKVEIKLHAPSCSARPGDEWNGCPLGETILGENAVIGQDICGPFRRLEFNIGPLKNTNIADFFENGPAQLLLNNFYDYFIPVELDVEKKLVLEQKPVELASGKTGYPVDSFLGFNTML